MFDIANLTDEYFLNLDPNENLQIKKLDIDDKVKCFEFFLSSDSISNISVITNIFILINGITNIDDNLINDERLFFNSLEEYVDIKLQIKNKIDSFNIRLLEYYLGVIEGLDVNLYELKTHIPNTHFNIMYLVTPNLISKLTLKYLKKINLDNVKPAHCANELYDKINNPTSLMTEYVQSLLNEVKNNGINLRATLQ